jgi:hypothetical protein
MTAVPRHPRHGQEENRPQPTGDHPAQKKAGRPKGAPSTIVNLRIPVDLLAQLDRYIDRLEVQTGLKANRGMIARRALACFLERQTPEQREHTPEGTHR